MTRKAVIIAVALIFQTLQAAEQFEFESKDLSALSVSVMSGKVTVQAVEGPKASVSVTKNKFSDHCNLTIDKKDHKLVVKVEKSPRFFSLADCDVNFEIKVPKKIDSDLKVGSGAITLSGLQGELSYSLGSGEVIADGVFSILNGKSGSGPISVSGLAGSGNIKSGSGAVNVTFDNKPEKGALEIQCGAGDATVSLPKGSKIKTTFIAGSGKMSNEVGENPDAAYLISVKTGSGNLKIKAR